MHDEIKVKSLVMTGIRCKMSPVVIFLLLLLLGSLASVLLAEPKATAPAPAPGDKFQRSCTSVNQSHDHGPDHHVILGMVMMISIGGVMNERSRVGKEERIAAEMAVHDFNRLSHCTKLALYFQDSQGNSARAASAVAELVGKKEAHAILGQLTFQEATLLWDLDKVGKDVPIISMAPLATSPPLLPSQPPSFIRIGTDINIQMQCIAAIIGHFRWRKVISIYEHSNSFSADSLLITHLSDSLRDVESSIEQHVAFPPVGSDSNHKKHVGEELTKLRSKNVKVFIVLQASLDFATLLFRKAKELHMMEKGYAWIVSDDVGNLLDSIHSSVMENFMQGVIGLKTNYLDTSDSFRAFELGFRRKYRSQYPEEELYSNPSVFALRAYDATWTIAKAIQNSEENVANSRGALVNSILNINFEGLSGKISFKNGALLQKPVYRLVNVIGRSYRTIAFWSHEFGFSEGLNERDGRTRMKIGNGMMSMMGSIYWPGGELTVPPGLTIGSLEKPLRIGVPATGAFRHFVNVTFDQNRNETTIRGFSIQVFEAVVKHLPYHLHYELVPYTGSYDEMVAEVRNKRLDAAVGDTEIMADRYEIAEFTQPYLDSGLVMVVTVKPDVKATRFFILKAFKWRMWIVMAVMSVCTGVVIWLNEHANNNPEFKGKFPQNIGSMLWFSVTVLSFAQREPIRSNLSRLVLATWLFVTVLVTACFTASVTSMMTLPRNEPSIVDIDYLLANNVPVGCNGNSFICRFLIDALHFKQENVRRIGSIGEYPGAFQRGDIKAAFFVAPHAKVFLGEYCNGYTIAGPNIKLGGFGFVFQKGSPLATDLSEAILKVIQSGAMNQLERHMLSYLSCSSSSSSSGGESTKQGQGPGEIDIGPFFVLFLVSGCLLAVAFLNAIALLVEKHFPIYDCIPASLLSRGVFQWASLLLLRFFTEFGTTFIRLPHLKRPNNEMNMVAAAHQLEPDALIATQLPAANASL